MRPLHVAPAAALLLCMGALAPPRLVPTHDVTIDYLVHPGTGRDQSVRVSIEAGGGRLRIVGEDLPVNVLVDRQAGLAHVLVPLLRAYTSLSITRYDPERTVLRHASFSRAGSERLAGGPCTDWLATSASGSASACITDGGVILKGEVTNRHGRVASLMATAVDYAPLPAWTWSLPGDYHDLGPLALDRLGLGSPR